MLKPFLILLIGLMFTVSGELMLKQGMNTVGTLGLHPSVIVPGLIRTFTNPFILGGFVLVFTASIFWLSVISRIPLSLAYPLMSVSYVLVVLASWLLLKESIPVTRMIGVLIIICGVVVVYRS